MRQQEKDLVNRFSGQFDHVKNYMETNVEKLKNDTKAFHDKMSQSMLNVKKVCSNYFEKYETDLDDLKL